MSTVARMNARGWIGGALLALALAVLAIAVGGPVWAVGLGLVGGFLVVLLTFGLRE